LGRRRCFVNRRLAALASFIVLFALPASAQDVVVLHATPTSKVDSSSGATLRKPLSESEAQEARLLIVKRDGRYVWASRDGRTLVHTTSGAFHYFIDPNGAGLIKLVDQSVFGSLADPGPPVQYFEFLSLGLGTITYFGTASSFSL